MFKDGSPSCHPHYFLTHSLLLLALIAAAALSVNAVPAEDDHEQKKFYIVYLGDRHNDEESAVQTHIDLLSTVKGSDEDAKDSIIHSYTKNFNAFVAKLSANEANELSSMERVASVFPNRYHKLQTTRSWDFIGLPQNARRKLKMESDIVVGLLDSGITPQSSSFKDTGFGPPPKKWKGGCGRYANFSGCNNKLIGAKFFKLDRVKDEADIASPVDVNGHGTHTSSTLAGSAVANASLFGLAQGVARGAVPSARVAMYKVCWISSGCSDMDILAGFDSAIHDGVDVISLSIGGYYARYTEDSIAIGSFHAMRKNIVTVAAAGNGGPSLGTLVNTAPWLLTVAASGIDRQFRNKVVLGNGHTASGTGINTFDTSKKLQPLVRGIDIAKDSSSKESARFCYENSLDPAKVKGKIIYCERDGQTDMTVKTLGGVGAIIDDPSDSESATIYVTPAIAVNATVAKSIDTYIDSTKSASATIWKSEEEKMVAPFVASFSSRGPNPGSNHLLKPDIAAPGVSILASYTPLRSITGWYADTRHSKFNLLSGTSMACPHVAGVAAYVKSFHPDWSPAAIKSAIITSAKPMSSRVNKEAEYAYGAGQLNPRNAVSPGLVYDTNEESYIRFLCQEGYNASSLRVLVGSKPINCSALLQGAGYDAINYPTMHLTVTKRARQPTIGIFQRIVTNVGPPNSTYKAIIRAPYGVEVSVEPTILTFSLASETQRFKVEVKASPMSQRTQMLSGYLAWKSDRHVVRSPIVVRNPNYTVREHAYDQ
ncbi:subtilisin-like protease SBT4.14 [Malania oleifera]|uniref:subtilisin-like protease SBT4.14 n=1 Tax=Malania oleifera TaxID=397392 RepID=UPI0025AE4DA7|nr:subtilisin-like protease SBT4.14 [Malania oleifera]